MEQCPQDENKAELAPATVSDEIRKAYDGADFLVKGRDVLLEDYMKMKAEVREVLSSVGLWSSELDTVIDSSLIYLGGIGRCLESIAKSMVCKPSELRSEELKRYQRNAMNDLQKIGIMTPSWETWMQRGAPADLNKVGECFYYMSRVYAIVASSQASERILRNLESQRQNKTSQKRRRK